MNIGWLSDRIKLPPWLIVLVLPFASYYAWETGQLLKESDSWPLWRRIQNIPGWVESYEWNSGNLNNPYNPDWEPNNVIFLHPYEILTHFSIFLIGGACLMYLVLTRRIGPIAVVFPTALFSVSFIERYDSLAKSIIGIIVVGLTIRLLLNERKLSIIRGA